jgi:hypothetical protein
MLGDELDEMKGALCLFLQIRVSWRLPIGCKKRLPPLVWLFGI